MPSIFNSVTISFAPKPLWHEFLRPLCSYVREDVCGSKRCKSKGARNRLDIKIKKQKTKNLTCFLE